MNANIARTLGLALGLVCVLSGAAQAGYVFECGTYAVHGKLYTRNSSRGKMTYLVLFEDSFSETIIPVTLTSKAAEQLKEVDAEPISGQFVIDLDNEGAVPKHAELISFASSVRVDLLKSVSGISKIKKNACAATPDAGNAKK